MNAQQRRVARRAILPQVQAAADLWKARREALLRRVAAGPIDNCDFTQRLRTLVQTGVSVSPAPAPASAPHAAVEVVSALFLRSYRDDTTGVRVVLPPLWSVYPDGSLELVDEDPLVALRVAPAPAI